MAGRGSPPRRQDGVPSAHREAEFSPRIAGGDASQGEVSPTRRWRGYQAAGAIAGQAATIRAAALLTVSRPAGPARGGRNRRRACHMAGRGSAPRRQDGVPSAHREAEFSPRIAGGDASQGEVSPTRRWRGYQAAGASRGRRQPSGQRPRCPSARLPVPRVAGAIAAAHAIWREGGAPRAGRTEFPPHIAGAIAAAHTIWREGGSAPRRQDGVPSAHRGSGGNHPGSGPVVRQPACRSRAWRAQSPPRMPYGGKGERPAQAGRSSLRASRGRRQPSGQRPC